MRAVVQRVSEAEVLVEGARVGAIREGLAVLVAAHARDSAEDARRMADKVWGLRILADEQGKMNLSLRDVAALGRHAVLAIPNFTLYGDASKNRRPSFVNAAPFEKGEPLWKAFVRALKDLGCRVECGVFGAHMEVRFVNDGPVTVILDAGPKAPDSCGNGGETRLSP